MVIHGNTSALSIFYKSKFVQNLIKHNKLLLLFYVYNVGSGQIVVLMQLLPRCCHCPLSLSFSHVHLSLFYTTWLQLSHTDIMSCHFLIPQGFSNIGIMFFHCFIPHGFSLVTLTCCHIIFLCHKVSHWHFDIVSKPQRTVLYHKV